MRDARHAVGIPTFLQRGVVGLAAESQPLVQHCSLVFGRVESVLKGLVHLAETFFLGQAQPETIISPPQKERAFHPRNCKSGAFRRGTLVNVDHTTQSSFFHETSRGKDRRSMGQ